MAAPQQQQQLLLLLVATLLNACFPSAFVICATATSRFAITLRKSGSPSPKSKAKQKSSKKKSRRLSIGHGANAGSTASFIIIIIIAVAVILIVAIWWWRRHRAQKYIQKTEKLAASYGIASRDAGELPLRLFSHAEMKQSTDNFDSEQVIGCGSFGKVYKGVLDDQTQVAIKSVKTSGLEGKEKVLNEVQALLKVNNHQHLVRLLGLCVRWKRLLLVYEHAPTGSLSDQLVQYKDHGTAAAVLDWKARLRVALQSAEALSHLHSAGLICHGNVNSNNILLDQSMNARVSEYGLSRFLGMDEKMSDKSDVYSFGVLLLELILSSRALAAFESGQDYVNQLVVMMQTKKEKGELDDMLDPELVKGESAAETMQSMRAVVDIALQCVHENEVNRPGMEEVAEKLRQMMLSAGKMSAVCDDTNQSRDDS